MKPGTTQIWKFNLDIISPIGMRLGTVLVDMPRDARVLSVDMQHGNVKIWAMVDVEAPVEPRGFYILGTGIRDDYFNPAFFDFVGTVVTLDSYVAHVFVRNEL